MEGNSSLGTGFMAVFAVSGSVVLLAHQFHKRLLSDFMKKMEFELGSGKNQMKKKVRFSDDVEELSMDDNEDLKKLSLMEDHNNENKKCRKTMPLNWQVMYKGIIDYRNSAYFH